MIVASLLLILVAVTLLVLGLAGGSSGLLIGSIVASLLAAVALVVGARQAAAARRTVRVEPAFGEAEEFGRSMPTRHPDVGADPPPPARPFPPDPDLVEPEFLGPDRADPDRADPGRADDARADVPEGAHADLSGDLRADSPDPSDDLRATGATFSEDDQDAAFSEDGQDTAYAAGRRDAADQVAGPESTQRVQPDADLQDDAAAGRPSSGQAAGAASSRERAAAAGEPRTDDTPWAGATGSPWAAPAAGAVGSPWSRGPGQGTPPEDDPAVADEPVSARRGDRAEPAAPVDEFDEPDPDDPDDEPLPQAVRPADAVRVARLDAEVLVVDGRPRYHLADCPHLVGRLTEGLPVAEAVELGFSPCGLCRPVDRLVAAAAPR